MATKQQERETQVVRTWRRPDGEVRLSLNTYKGREMIDLRTFWQPDDEEEMQPTRKGVSMHAEQLPDLIAGLITAAKLAEVDLSDLPELLDCSI